MYEQSKEDARRPRVLIADDNTDAAETLAILCRTWGHTVLTAADGLRAIEIGESFEPRVAVLDLDMPHLNGYQVARRLREKFGATIVLIALTAWDDTQNSQRVRAAGFDHHVIKPGDLDELRTLMNQTRMESLPQSGRS